MRKLLVIAGATLGLAVLSGCATYPGQTVDTGSGGVLDGPVVVNPPQDPAGYPCDDPNYYDPTICPSPPVIIIPGGDGGWHPGHGPEHGPGHDPDHGPGRDPGHGGGRDPVRPAPIPAPVPAPPRGHDPIPGGCGGGGHSPVIGEPSGPRPGGPGRHDVEQPKESEHPKR